MPHFQDCKISQAARKASTELHSVTSQKILLFRTNLFQHTMCDIDSTHMKGFDLYWFCNDYYIKLL